MSDASARAVFLSYASQDAEAAKRICDALRAAGVEVWFDQSELRGGDSWDAKIRKQIKECALFVPIISPNTNSRPEGYFRLEWKLAVDRSHLLADDHPFLFPVVIGEVNDATARVPDKFRDVQWTRLRLDETPAELARRVTRLLSNEPGAGCVERTAEDRQTKRMKRPAWLRYAWAAVGLTLALVYGLRPLWQPAHKESEPARVAMKEGAPSTQTSATGFSEARQMTAKARQLFESPEVTNRENLLLARQLCDKAIEIDPADAEAWAARAQLSYLMISYGHDRTPARMESLVSDAERALALAPNSYEARLATAFALARQRSRRGEAEKSYRSLLQVNPADKRVLVNLGHLLRWEGGRNDEAFQLYDQAAALPGGDPIALADKANAYYFLARLPEAEKAVEQSLAQAPTGRAYLMHALLQMILRGDTARAAELLKRVPAATLHDNRGVNIAFRVWLWRREPARALEFLREVPKDYIEDIYFTGPKTVLTGWAQQLAGHPEAATADWESALAVLNSRGQDRSTNTKVVRCELLARLGRKEEANRLFAEIGETEGVDWPRSGTNALNLLVVLGRNDEALALLPALIDKPGPAPLTRPELRLNPLYDSLRGDPRFAALVAESRAMQPDRAVAVPAPEAKSVAVLAFDNLSDDKANEYFSDGISEELLNVLAKIPGLKVTARTSSFHFKGKDTPIPEIAQQLGVAYVVEGSVRKAGDKVRITAQLIKAADDFHVWSDTFTRDLKDIFAVQDEIAGLIAQNLQLKLGMSAQAGQTANPDAHQLYLQGKYFLGRTTLEDTARATTLLQRAVELDPSFAQAWAALSGAGWFRGGYGNNRQDFDEGFALARRAADRAIALEPALAAGHIARFDVQSSIDFDWKGALESLRRAQVLAPNDPAVVFRAAQLAYSFGEEEKATQLIRQAVALDPVNPAVYITQGYISLAVHHFADAEAAFRHIVDISPAAPWGHAGMGMAMIARGQCDQAVIEAEQEVPEWSRLYVLSLARWGQKKPAEADAVLGQFIKANADVAAYQIATVHAYRGEPDRAFEWLERAYRQRDPGLGWAKSDFFLQPLHDDPRWDAFMHKLGLADDQLK
jgi:TolB-like protein/Flp pilus assembly protein TadD